MNSSTPASPSPSPSSSGAAPEPPRLPRSRFAPKLAFILATLATLAGLFWTVANRRGLRAEPADSQASPDPTSAKAERVIAYELIPKPVPDDQNFGATPFFAAVFGRPPQTESARWPDDFSRADQWPRRFPRQIDSAEGRRTGRFITDLVSWQRAFEQSRAGTDANREEIPVAENPDPTANAQAAVAVLAALQPYQSVLAELHEANQRRPYSRFNVNYNLENPFGILLPQLAVVKRTCQLLRLKISAELAAQHPDQALADALLLCRLVDAPRDEPVLISQLVRVACLQIGIQSIWEGLAEHRWSEAQLATLQSRLQKFDFIADLHRAMKAERAWANVTIGMIRDKRTPDLFLSLVTGTDGKNEPWQREAERAFRTCPREWFDQEQENLNRIYDERMMTVADFAARRIHPAVAEENSAFVIATGRNTRTLLKDHLVFAKSLLVEPAKITLKLAHAQATVDLAAVACALERHRLAHQKYPETLAELVPAFLEKIPADLIDGQPLRYRRTDDGLFLLYAIGWNANDDGGDVAFLAGGRAFETKEGDWVWRYPKSSSK
jgi:hypothetical protein